MVRTVFALVMREMSTTHGRSAFGFLWAIMEPVAAIALMTVVFSVFMRNPPLGTNFPLFYVTGIVPFQIYAHVGNRVSAAVRFSRSLLAFPAVTAVDAILARFLLNLFMEILIFAIVTVAIVYIYDLHLILRPEMIFYSFAMGALFALGIGTFNCVLFVAYPSYEQIWAVLTRPLFLVSGVFFLYKDVPGLYADIIWFNPIVHWVGLMRAGFYPSYDADYVSPLYVVTLSLVLLSVGLVTLRRFIHDALDS